MHHWTDKLFSFVTTRDPGFRFENSQFTMIGRPVEGRSLLRAYRLASANHEGTLEFFSIKVQGGPLTSRLQHLKEGDKIIVGRKATGTLLLDNLTAGRHLYFAGTGTGLAPFLSLIKDLDTYAWFEKIVLVHSCRHMRELAYGERITRELPVHEFLGKNVREQLIYYPTVAREPFRNTGRITDLLQSGKLCSDIDLAPLDIKLDRVMICGNSELLRDLKGLLEAQGAIEGNHGEPSDFVVEKPFVDR